MQSVHTEPSQINDFNAVAKSQGFEPIDLSAAVIANDIDGQLEQPTADTSNDLPAGEVLHLLFSQTFQILAPNWRIQNDEINALVGAYEPVIEKYGLADKITLGVEVNAILVTLIIFAPRMNKPRKEKQINEPPKQQEQEPLGGFGDAR